MQYFNGTRLARVDAVGQKQAASPGGQSGRSSMASCARWPKGSRYPHFNIRCRVRANMSLSLVSVALVIALISVDAVAATATAGPCRKGTHNVAISKGNALRLSDYVCSSDRDAQTKVRVEFQRLSEVAAGALLNSGSAPSISTLYGKYRVADNDVLKEYRSLITRFGSAVQWINEGVEGTAFALKIKMPGQASTGEPQSVLAGRGARVLSFE